MARKKAGKKAEAKIKYTPIFGNEIFTSGQGGFYTLNGAGQYVPVRVPSLDTGLYAGDPEPLVVSDRSPMIVETYLIEGDEADSEYFKPDAFGVSQGLPVMLVKVRQSFYFAGWGDEGFDDDELTVDDPAYRVITYYPAASEKAGMPITAITLPSQPQDAADEKLVDHYESVFEFDINGNGEIGKSDSLYPLIQVDPDAAAGGVLQWRNGDKHLLGGAKDEAIYGTADEDIISGGNGNDYLFARGGADILRGGEGNDLLNGGSGDDVLTGGKGADLFKLSEGIDIVTDFNNFSSEGERDYVAIAPNSTVKITQYGYDDPSPLYGVLIESTTNFGASGSLFLVDVLAIGDEGIADDLLVVNLLNVADL